MRMRNKQIDVNNNRDVEILKARRIAFWEYAHTLDDSDPVKADVEEKARMLYDKLTAMGVKLI